MNRPLLEVADIIRRHGGEFLDLHGASVTSSQHRILRALVDCRTVALGGHVDECDSCGHRHPSYNSCRNRHCPKCHASATADWFDEHRDELLPVPYFHLVFTLPASLRGVALQNKRLIYGLLFEAASQTLLTIAADPKHLGASIGFSAVLHTWGQTLQFHPHLHCLVPGGGMAPDRSHWIPSRDKFFLPVKVLSRMFRGKFLALLERAKTRGKLQVHGAVAELREPARWRALINKLYRKAWVVYAKPPFGGAESGLKYLARYTHRIAIANERLISLQDGVVRFNWRDYADQSRQRMMTLQATEFIRRFLLHEIPSGFMRVRNYGFLANSSRAKNLERCRQLLAHESLNPPVPAPPPPGIAQESTAITESTEERVPRCPVCKVGTLRFLHDLAPLNDHPKQQRLPGMDSS